VTSNSASLDTSKLAVVYLRQSSPGQVRDHVIATQEQYGLRAIPERLGFLADRIIVVDDDLGVSGQTIAGRKGMLRVLGLLEREEAACVVVRDISRLSRDEFNTDMGLIARQCFLSGAMIITPEKTYDPADSSDQLLLGLQGLIAGWDRANIVRRLNHHRRAKQAKGTNINGAVPAGYEKVIDVPRGHPDHGKLRITSDPKVRERITLILRKGLELKGVFAVLRYLRGHNLLVPVFRGEEERLAACRDGRTRAVSKGRRTIRWTEATRDSVTRILKNPTYAGAIVNSLRTSRLDRKTGTRRWQRRRRYEDCTVIHDAHEGYITWEEHHEILSAIARNNRAKVFGNGEALLSGLGLLRCGVCGTAMVVQYNNPVRRSRGRTYRNTPFYYVCSRRTPEGRLEFCQNPAGPYIDRAARELILYGLGKLNLDGLKEALDGKRARLEEETRLRLQQVEVLDRRARMLEEAIADAKTAEARTRLVARFEEAVSELEAARKSAAAPAPAEESGISPELIRRLEVFRDPEVAWAGFSQKKRKEVLRALAKTVLIYPDSDGYIVVFEWDGGGRAAAKVDTTRRRKLYEMPEEVLALFGGELSRQDVSCRVASHSWTSCRSSPSTCWRPSGSRWKTPRSPSAGPRAPSASRPSSSSSPRPIPAAGAAGRRSSASARQASGPATSAGCRAPCSIGSICTWRSRRSRTGSWGPRRQGTSRPRSARASWKRASASASGSADRACA
jgi:DNA invertase Pin-like site-specific DNA recombinase